MFEPILHGGEPIHIPTFIVSHTFGLIGEAAVNEVDAGAGAFGIQFPAHERVFPGGLPTFLSPCVFEQCGRGNVGEVSAGLTVEIGVGAAFTQIDFDVIILHPDTHGGGIGERGPNPIDGCGDGEVFMNIGHKIILSGSI